MKFNCREIKTALFVVMRDEPVHRRRAAYRFSLRLAAK